MPLLARLGEKRASPDETMDQWTDLSKDISKYDHRKAKFTPHMSEYVFVVFRSITPFPFSDSCTHCDDGDFNLNPFSAPAGFSGNHPSNSLGIN